jgi:hypothetical protein
VAAMRFSEEIIPKTKPQNCHPVEYAQTPKPVFFFTLHGAPRSVNQTGVEKPDFERFF